MRQVMAPLPTGPKNKDHLWKPGESGNPGGKRKGVRNRLSNQFLEDMLADWETHGKDAIVTFRKQRPHEYVKVMAALVPREFNMKINEYEELSDDQVRFQIGFLLRELAAEGVAGFAAGVEIAAEPEPASEIPALPEAG